LGPTLALVLPVRCVPEFDFATAIRLDYSPSP